MSYGEDQISAEALLRLHDEALDALPVCASESWSQRVFPACLKSAPMISSVESEKSKDPFNFRPISHLPTLSNVVKNLLQVDLERS